MALSRSRTFHFWAIKLMLICILVFILQYIFPGFTNFILLSQSHPLQIWRFLTAIFAHANLGHLVLNMFALGIFGSILEKLIGSKSFVTVFFVTGVLANLIAINFYQASLGASGAIYGVLGALIIVRPLMAVWALGMPMPVFLAGILYALLDLIGIFNPTGTADIAHLSGLAAGLVLGLFYRDWSSKRNTKEKINLDEGLLRKWEDYYMKDI